MLICENLQKASSQDSLRCVPRRRGLNDFHFNMFSNSVSLFVWFDWFQLVSSYTALRASKLVLSWSCSYKLIVKSICQENVNLCMLSVPLNHTIVSKYWNHYINLLKPNVWLLLHANDEFISSSLSVSRIFQFH